MANNKNGFKSLKYIDDHRDEDDRHRRLSTGTGRPEDGEHLLSKSDLSSFASDESLSPPPPTIPIRKRSLQERRNVGIAPLHVIVPEVDNVQDE